MDKSNLISTPAMENSRFSLLECLVFIVIYGSTLLVSRACWLVGSAEESPALDEGLRWQAITLISVGALINSVALMLWGRTALAAIRTYGSRTRVDPGFWLVQLLGLSAIFELLTSGLIVVSQQEVGASRGEWLQECLGLISLICVAIVSFVAVVKLRPLRIWQAFYAVNGFGLPLAMLLSDSFSSDVSVDLIALGGTVSSILLILACRCDAPLLKELSQNSRMGIFLFLAAAGWHVAWTTILYRFFVSA